MVTPKQIKEKTMTESKKKGAKYDVFAFYVGRPISYVLTVPFIELKIKPNIISLLSLFPSILGFFFLGFGNTLILRLIGGFLFLLWNFMDGVDGNAARYLEQPSKMGRLWDATSGYVAMMLMFFSMGIACFNSPHNQVLPFLGDIPDYYYIVMGGMTSVLELFYRLVMHKKMLLYGEEAGEGLNDKNTYSLPKIIALNVISTAGLLQVFMLICIYTNCIRLFVFIYCVIQVAVTIWTLKRMLRLTSDEFLE